MRKENGPTQGGGGLGAGLCDGGGRGVGESGKSESGGQGGFRPFPGSAWN